MNQVQIRRYEMLVRVRDFGTAHADLFPKPSVAHDAFTTVAETVEQLTAHTVSKLSTAQGTANKAKARAALLDLALKVAQTGRVIAGHTPDTEEKFALSTEPTDQELLMRARVIAGAAEPMKDLFIARLLPKTFLVDLGAAIEAFEAAIRQRRAGKDQRKAASTHIEQALAAGDDAARALDAMVRNRLGDDAATMEAWWQNRRVMHPPRRAPRVKRAAAAPPSAATSAPVEAATPKASPAEPPDVTNPKAA